MDSCADRTQISTRIIKEATGIDFTVKISGASKCLNQLYFAAKIAIRIPTIIATIKPKLIFTSERTIDW